MNIDAEKLNAVARSLARDINGFCSKSEVTVGTVDGVVFRLVAMDTEEAEDTNCTDGPEWAQCIMKGTTP
jgi:hypothetical protein